MKTRHALLATLIALAMVGLAATPVTADAATRQSTAVLTFPGTELPPLEDVGEARLLRNDHGVRTTVSASGVEPGVYTLWWVVWNAPEACATAFACTDADLFDPDVGVDIGYGGGALVGPNGRLHLASHLSEEADLTGFPTEFGVPLSNTGLVDARHAEIHLVIRSHGPVVTELAGEMLHTFNAACAYEPPLDESQPSYGTPGPNTCVDQYFAVFPSEDTS